MKKKETLFLNKEKSIKDMNIFEQEMYKQKHTTTSGNGSLKYTTSGNLFLDDFAAISNYRALRDPDDIFDLMEHEWFQDPLTTLKLMCYIRLITRQTKYNNVILTTQRGQGLKHEFICRLLWISKRYPEILTDNNLDIFVACGSYEDLFQVLRYQLYYDVHGNTENIYNYILKHKDNDLCKKFAPQVLAASKCKKTIRKQANTIIAKKLAIMMFDGDKKTCYIKYNKWKSSGKATEWQAAISQQRYQDLDFKLIPSRARNILMKSNFLTNHNLTYKFEEFVKKAEKLDFKGFVFELFSNSSSASYQVDTINKEFLGMIDTAKDGLDLKSNFITCIDTSGSMESTAVGTDVTSITVASSIALYFSYLLKGRFQNTYLEFNRECEFKEFKGDTPYEKFSNMNNSGWCDTNVLSIAYRLCDLKQRGYSEDEFPTGVLCISDGEFNYSENKSCFEKFLDVLKDDFSKEFVDNFKLVLWDVPNSFYGNKIRPKFESLGNRPGFYYMSGLDPAAITALMHGEMPATAEELMYKTLDQDLLNSLTL